MLLSSTFKLLTRQQHGRLLTQVATAKYASTSATCHNSNSNDDDDQPVEMEDPYLVAPKRCILCGVKVDYKNVQLLSQFVSSFTGLIHPHDTVNLCDKKYDQVKTAIKLSRRSGFMPHILKEPLFHDDPVLTTKERSRFLER